MASVSFASGAGASRRASPSANASGSLAAVFLTYVAPPLAFLFAFSVARIGMVVIPMTTNVSWALAYVAIIPVIARNPNLYLTIVRRNAVLFTAGVFATASAIWSYLPGLSAYFGILYMLNLIVGAVIAQRFGLWAVMRFVFWFSLIVQIVSLVLGFGHSPIAIDDSGNFRGLYSTKNVVAMHACILYLTAFLLLLDRWRPMVSILGIATAICGIILSRSGTGMLMMFFVTAFGTACYVFSRHRRNSLVLFGSFLIVASLAVAAVSLANVNLSDGVLNAIGKDATLTGRTLLWDKAFQSFEAQPWFGIGYLSYWYSPQSDAAEIWILTGQELMSFHNIYLDRLVDVGIVGLALFLAGLVLIVSRCIGLVARQKSITWIWSLTFVAFLCALGLSEYPMFWNSDLQLVLSIIAAATTGIRQTSRT
jgi:exopolysaccharide production protein ExoQ